MTGTATNNGIVEENEIVGDNYARFDHGWEAGGGKWTRMQTFNRQKQPRQR
jgi:hypothetical protein